jgi:hypothetical protein
MKLFELLEKEDSPEPGTYAAVKFDESTVNNIRKYIENNEIPNGVPAEKLHCTVLYSRKHCPDYEPQGDIDPAWIGTPVGLEVWESKGKLRDEEPKRCLVMKFKCEELNDRHKELMDEHDATYVFPEYKTHVTLSYDIGDLDEKTLPDIADAISKLKINHEYGEDLDLDWAAKTKS